MYSSPSPHWPVMSNVQNQRLQFDLAERREHRRMILATMAKINKMPVFRRHAAMRRLLASCRYSTTMSRRRTNQRNIIDATASASSITNNASSLFHVLLICRTKITHVDYTSVIHNWMHKYFHSHLVIVDKWGGLVLLTSRSVDKFEIKLKTKEVFNCSNLTYYKCQFYIILYDSYCMKQERINIILS